MNALKGMICDINRRQLYALLPFYNLLKGDLATPAVCASIGTIDSSMYTPNKAILINNFNMVKIQCYYGIEMYDNQFSD